jgi:hypothetical protein
MVWDSLIPPVIYRQGKWIEGTCDAAREVFRGRAEGVTDVKEQIPKGTGGPYGLAGVSVAYYNTKGK